MENRWVITIFTILPFFSSYITMPLLPPLLWPHPTHVNAPTTSAMGPQSTLNVQSSWYASKKNMDGTGDFFHFFDIYYFPTLHHLLWFNFLTKSHCPRNNSKCAKLLVVRWIASLMNGLGEFFQFYDQSIYLQSKLMVQPPPALILHL